MPYRARYAAAFYRQATNNYLEIINRLDQVIQKQDKQVRSTVKKLTEGIFRRIALLGGT